MLTFVFIPLIGNYVLLPFGFHTHTCKCVCTHTETHTHRLLSSRKRELYCPQLGICIVYFQVVFVTRILMLLSGLSEEQFNRKKEMSGTWPWSNDNASDIREELEILSKMYPLLLRFVHWLTFLKLKKKKKKPSYKYKTVKNEWTQLYVRIKSSGLYGFDTYLMD